MFVDSDDEEEEVRKIMNPESPDGDVYVRLDDWIRFDFESQMVRQVISHEFSVAVNLCNLCIKSTHIKQDDKLKRFIKIIDPFFYHPGF